MEQSATSAKARLAELQQQRGATVRGVLDSFDVAVFHETFYRVGHARGVHLQAIDRAGKGQSPGTREGQHAQHLVPREGQRVWFQGRIDTGLHELLGVAHPPR